MKAEPRFTNQSPQPVRPRARSFPKHTFKPRQPEDGEQKAEDGGQKPEGGGRKAESIIALLLLLSILYSLLTSSASAQVFHTNSADAINVSGDEFTTQEAGTFGLLPTMDRDATNFVIRAGLTQSRELLAIDSLVKDLKATKLWEKLLLFSPFVGSSSNAHRLNLVSTNYPIVWFGTNLHLAEGVRSDGVSGYGLVNLQPGVWTRTNQFHTAAWFDTSGETLGRRFFQVGRTNESVWSADNSPLRIAWGSTTNTSSPTPPGSFLVNTTNSTYTLARELSWRNSYGEAAILATNSTLWLLAGATTGSTTVCGTNITLQGVSFGNALNERQAIQLLHIVNRYQTALRRNMN